MTSKTFRTPNHYSRSTNNASTSTSTYASTSSAAAAIADSGEYDMLLNDQEGIPNDGGTRVYWYAPPSPSLQLQQAEHQRMMARAGAIGPMASQAFREELMQNQEENDYEKAPRIRKVSRRCIRKSNASLIGNDERKSLVNPGNERDSNGIDQILDDLDQHLMHRKIGLFSDENEEEEEIQKPQNESYFSLCVGKEIEVDRLQQDLIDGMDRAFSQEKQIPFVVSSTLPPLSRTTKNWSRTSSVPVRSLHANISQINRLTTLEDDEGRVNDVTLGKRNFPHSPENGADVGHVRSSSFDDMFASPGKPVARPTKSSPNKRRASVANKIRPLQEQDSNVTLVTTKQRKGQFSRTVSDGAHLINETVIVKKESMLENVVISASTGRAETMKKDHVQHDNASPASIAPKYGMKKSSSAHFQRTAPRVGLSRSAALSSSRQQRVMSNHTVFSTVVGAGGSNNAQHPIHSNGPNAPFKKPTLKSPPKTKSPQKSKRSSSGISEVVVIDDSSDEEDKIVKGKHLSTKKEIDSKSAVSSVVTKDKTSIEPVGEVSFDTSLDDEALCGVLDAVEASQTALTADQGQKQIKQNNGSSQIQPKSDDSFDTSIDEDVSAAILSHMDAEGW